jgi:Protein of unknown function (DUF3667)
MTGELAAAADFVTGAAVARAVEPDTGSDENGSGNCLNCGMAILGNHCHQCGQKARVHRTLHAYGHDFLHSVLHFDGKIWRTIPMLFWKPGQLTKRYVYGERAKFVSPLALFLFTVFFTFACANWILPKDTIGVKEATPKTAQQEYISDRREILDSIAELERQKPEATEQGGAAPADVEESLSKSREKLAVLDAERAGATRKIEAATREFVNGKSKLQKEIAALELQFSTAKKAGLPTDMIQQKLDGAHLGLKVMNGAAVALDNGEASSDDWTFTDLKFPGSAELNNAVAQAKENPQLLLYKAQTNTYKYSWALIPISMPFVWLLFFWRRRFKMYDHAVFVTYSITFMMLFGVLCMALIAIPQTEIIGGLAMFAIPPIHMYRHIHGAYETSRFGAFWRMCLLLNFALAALMLFAVLIVTLGVAG